MDYWLSGFLQLGVPSSTVQLSSYNSFQGQVQLMLFNGQQWGLWNIRSASDTSLIGSFQRSDIFNHPLFPPPPLPLHSLLLHIHLHPLLPPPPPPLLQSFLQYVYPCICSNGLALSNTRSSFISFDGNGYLFVKMLSSNTDLGNRLNLMINTLPSDARDGLIIYAYDTTVSRNLIIGREVK